MSQVFVGLDIGGTKIIAAAADEDGNILRREQALTPQPLAEGLALLDRMIRTVAAGDQIAAMGAGAGGPLNWETGVVSPLHQPDWRAVPLKERMEAKYDCRFTVEVDTNVAALAEYHHAPAGRDRRDKPGKLLYITLSTGMGGGLVVEGEIYRGMQGEHPEVGHQSVSYRRAEHGAVACPCGSTGCLEALVSGSGIRRLYGKAPEALRAREWDEVTWNLGQGLRNLAVIYLPDVIVLGGGITYGARDTLVLPAARVMREHLKIVPHPEVRMSALGADNVVEGAILLALRDGR